MRLSYEQVLEKHDPCPEGYKTYKTVLNRELHRLGVDTDVVKRPLVYISENVGKSPNVPEYVADFFLWPLFEFTNLKTKVEEKKINGFLGPHFKQESEGLVLDSK